MDRLPPAAQALLDAARPADDPTPEQRARGESAVRAALALHGITDLSPLLAPSALATDAVASHGSRATRLELGLKLGLAAAVVITASWFGLRGLGPDAPRPRAAPPATSPAAAPVPTALGAAHARMRSAMTTTAEAARSQTETAPVRDRPQREPQPRASRSPASDNALASEVRLIAQAHALEQAGHFDEALRVLDTHAQRFPRGALSDERSALRVLSLCGRGPSERGLREQERFLRAAPDSVLWARVRNACAPARDSEP